MLYLLEFSGEVLYVGDQDGPQQFSDVQVQQIRDVLLAAHPSGEASGVVAVIALDPAYETFKLQLTIDPEVFTGEVDWKAAVEHVQEVAHFMPELTPAQSAIEGALNSGLLEELGYTVQTALGRDYEFLPDTSVRYEPKQE